MICDTLLTLDAMNKITSLDERVLTNNIVEKGEGLFSLSSIYNGVTLEVGKKTHLI